MKHLLSSKLLVLASLLIITLASLISMGVGSSVVSAQGVDDAVNCGSDIDLDVKSNCAQAQTNEAVARCMHNTGKSEAQCKEQTKPSSKVESVIKTVINVLSALVGAIAVIMIVIGGFRYVTSGGDSNNISGAKNTILYAIVGLIIVAFAQIIVRFVLQKVT